MGDSATARRRWFGLFFLLLAAGMVMWGQIVLRPHLRGLPFLVYWLTCFILTLLAMGAAILDMRAVRRQAREEHRRLVERTLQAIEADRHPPDTRHSAESDQAKPPGA